MTHPAGDLAGSEYGRFWQEGHGGCPGSNAARARPEPMGLRGLSVAQSNRLGALWVMPPLKKKIIQNQYYESKESLFVTNMKKTRIVVDGRH